MPKKVDLQTEYEKRVQEANRKYQASLQDAEKMLKDRLERIEIWKKAAEAQEQIRKEAKLERLKLQNKKGE